MIKQKKSDNHPIRPLVVIVLLCLLLCACGKTAAPEPAPEPVRYDVTQLTDVMDQPAATPEPTATPAPEPIAESFVLNTNTKKYHDPACPSVDDIKAKNRRDYEGTREEVEAMGYVACKRCGG